MVRNAIEKHDEKITQKILKDKIRGKRVWQHINTLKNKDENLKNKIQIYNNTGKITEENLHMNL